MWCEKINDFIEVVFIQFYLENIDVKLIYVYEFHVNMKSTKLWIWNKRSYPSILPIDTDDWSINFVVSFSKFKFKSIMASSTSIKTSNFIWFLRDVWITRMKINKNSKSIWIIMDNSIVYTNNTTEESSLTITWDYDFSIFFIIKCSWEVNCINQRK